MDRILPLSTLKDTFSPSSIQEAVAEQIRGNQCHNAAWTNRCIVLAFWGKIMDPYHFPLVKDQESPALTESFMVRQSFEKEYYAKSRGNIIPF
ncbi:hypothetical protein TNIN_129431 [Trichonephila inaurata madagascariensis]|uniref:Uncharacterized protein n=1 Tax=Trichonephila inaurata madagascariensis TaxID=2747483 RepID=A0A8X6YMU4_9ARAC|nr:hypothetical protein TNIN_66071 [Trichonephila inaurata madagascariensis]GFY72464.1 hypothetical protein TNIN_129431 [Trichonephila inaurata madagascariensis]